MFLITSDKINISFIKYNTVFDFKANKIRGKDPVQKGTFSEQYKPTF